MRTYLRQIILLFMGFVGLIFVLNASYYFLSKNPKTCLVCHYLRPYYNLWSKSSHSEVSCVACHPERKLLMGKYALRYVSATYTSQPIARVKDTSCLACHEGQTLDTEEAFEGNITFNHNLHLKEPVRGVQLHCTTCHNHRTPGSYLKIDHNACFVCHFKGAQRGQSQTGCQTCHGNPKQEVEHQGFMFNHQAYIDIGLACGQCHVDVVKGDAAVPEEACFSCHVSRVEKFGDFPLVHQVHVREEMIDCFRCHGQIEHGKFGMISSLEVKCETCHVKLHTPERQMYIGSGGHGMGDEPSRMFLAQVSCDGCHVKGEAIGEAEFGAMARKTRRESCLLCHGRGYDQMLDDWLRETPAMLNAVKPYLEQTEGLVRSAQKRGREVDSLSLVVQQARYNFDFVRDGRLAHNVFYGIHLLKKSAEQLGDVRTKLGADAAMDLGPLLGKPDGYCDALCHSRIPRREQLTYEKAIFPHAMHAQDLELPCTTCHAPEQHGKPVITREACKNCHHQEYPISCVNCHWRENEIYRGECETLDLKKSPDIMAKAGVACDGCHDLTRPYSPAAMGAKCAACHDAEYKKLLDQWGQELDQAQENLTAKLDSCRTALKEAQKVGRRVWDENQAIEEISRRAEFIGAGGDLHNYAAITEAYTALLKKLDEVQARLQPKK